MAANIIEEVKKFELLAEETEKNARLNADNIIRKAEEKAKLILAEKAKETKTIINDNIAKAKNELENVVIDSADDINEEISNITQSASDKENEAIEMIINEITK